jgi:hypothetical protein
MLVLLVSSVAVNSSRNGGEWRLEAAAFGELRPAIVSSSVL